MTTAPKGAALGGQSAAQPGAEETLRAVTDNASAGFFIADSRGFTTFMNPAAERMTGFGLDDFRDRPAHDLVHHSRPDGTPYPAEACPISLALREGSAVDPYEDVFIRRDGTFFPVRVSAHPVIHDAQHLGAVVEVQDITATRLVEDRLRFLDRAGEMLAGLLSVDQALERVGEMAVPLIADYCFFDLYRPDGYLKRTAWRHRDPARVKLLERAARFAPPLGFEGNPVTDALRTGSPVLVEEVDEARLRAYAISPEHYELLREIGIVSSVAVPLPAAGEPIGVLTLGYAESGRRYARADVPLAQELARRAAQTIERARLLDELSFQNSVLQAQREASVEGLLLVSPAGKILFSNRRFAQLWGFDEELMATGSDEAALERALDRIVDPEAFMARVRYLYDHPDEPSTDEIVFHDGRLLERHGAPVRAEDGSYYGRLWSFRDLTERKRSEDALREANRQKDEFLAMLAHELRNPLAPILNAAELFARSEQGDGPLARAAEVVRRQVLHLTRLTDDLLEVSRLTRGKITLRRAPLELGALLRAVTDDRRAGLESNGLSVEVALPDESVWVHGDATRLSQVFDNLLVNAGKFTEPGGRVRVALEVEEEPGAAVVEVSDSGIGIDAPLLARLFQPFSQAEGDLAHSRGGLGLGLALVKGLVELHDGSVAAASEGPGRGATMTVRLPLGAAGADTEARQRGGARSAVVRQVLIIEDNADVAEIIALALDGMGHRVRVAANGREGLELARQIPPDVILCDVGLPGELDGYGVARSVRADPALAATRLVALTGYGQQRDRERTLAAGFDLHLTKPVSLDTLEQLLAVDGR